MTQCDGKAQAHTPAPAWISTPGQPQLRRGQEAQHLSKASPCICLAEALGLRFKSLFIDSYKGESELLTCLHATKSIHIKGMTAALPLPPHSLAGREQEVPSAPVGSSRPLFATPGWKMACTLKSRDEHGRRPKLRPGCANGGREVEGSCFRPRSARWGGCRGTDSWLSWRKDGEGGKQEAVKFY